MSHSNRSVSYRIHKIGTTNMRIEQYYKAYLMVHMLCKEQKILDLKK